MLKAAAHGVTLMVRAQPGAKRTAILGVFGEGSAGPNQDCRAGASA